MIERVSPFRRVARGLAWAALFLPYWVALVFLGQYVGLAASWSTALAVLAWIGVVVFLRLSRGALVATAVAALAAAGYLMQRPSNDRDWMPEIARLPQITREGDIIRIENLRDFVWSSPTEYEERWLTERYDLDTLVAVDAVVVPFGESELAAHVMLSFGFEDGRRLALSVETRREQGEPYSLTGGAARQLELIYLFGTEPDLLGLRIEHRGDRVFAFPLRLEKDFAADLLWDLCEAAHRLNEAPKFYASLRHNCTTTLLRHVNRVRSEPIGLYREVLFPAKLGALLHRLGYVDTDLPWPEAEAFFRVDEAIDGTVPRDSFSEQLRSGRGL